MAESTETINLSSLSIPGSQEPESEKMTKLLNEKKSAREFQLRKHADWNDNYELYRNKVKTNRLTQRQTVNIPLMKETIKTLISKVDDPPAVDWKELSGNQQKEIIYQQMWDDMFLQEDLELKDILDKKNVFLYGLSSKMLNLTEDGVCIDILDTWDIVYDPLMKALDVESARFIVRQNIFRTLREILADDRYEDDAKEQLKQWLDSPMGIVQSGKNKVEWERSMERLRSMGVMNEKFPVFAGGDVIVNLTEHYTSLWDTKDQKFVRHVVTYADDHIELYDDTLENCIGITEWPFDMWCDDPETNDVYPDGVADLVRTPNKILNIWFSQQVENRTLQNFQMHWYDATVQGYTPQTYEPGPGRMLPAPGDPNKTIMPVQVNGLDETFKAMDYITNIVERGTGATALEKGEPETGPQTLGEIQVLVGKATERAKTMSKFYKASWYRTSVKWDKIMQANGDSFPKKTMYKTGPDGKIYPKVIYPADWKSEAGYQPKVASSSEQEADDIKAIQKFGVVAAQFPNNMALKKIMQQRELKLLDLSPAELQEVQDAEDQAMAAAATAATAPTDSGVPNALPDAPSAPASPAAPAGPDLSPELQQLTKLMAS